MIAHQTASCMVVHKRTAYKCVAYEHTLFYTTALPLTKGLTPSRKVLVPNPNVPGVLEQYVKAPFRFLKTCV